MVISGYSYLVVCCINTSSLNQLYFNTQKCLSGKWVTSSLYTLKSVWEECRDDIPSNQT